MLSLCYTNAQTDLLPNSFRRGTSFLPMVFGHLCSVKDSSILFWNSLNRTLDFRCIKLAHFYANRQKICVWCRFKRFLAQNESFHQIFPDRQYPYVNLLEIDWQWKSYLYIDRSRTNWHLLLHDFLDKIWVPYLLIKIKLGRSLWSFILIAGNLFCLQFV